MLKRIYEAEAYAQHSGLASYWSETAERPGIAPLEGGVQADVVVIGGGYAGLNAAIQLAQQHQRSVVVLDEHWPGWGASGRNGGFCCVGGGMLGHAQLIKRWGESAAGEFAATQRRAITHVRKLLQSESIDASVSGEGEICLAHSRRAARGFAAEAEWLSRVHGVSVQHWSAAQARERGAVVQGCTEALHSPLGFGLNPWQYVQGLARSCLSAGVRLCSHSAALSVRPVEGGWSVKTARGVVAAKQLLIASNGYSSDSLPSWLAGRYLPVISSVLLTQPLSESDLRAQGFSTDTMSYDSRSLLHYFRRLPDGRFLFGTRGGVSASESAQQSARRNATADFHRMFPAWADVPLSHQWSGLLCLSGNLQPFVGQLPGCANAFAAFGWHGNGVALASYSGKLLADVMAKTAPADSICAPMRTVPRKIPLDRYRRSLLRPAYAAAQFSDRFL